MATGTVTLTKAAGTAGVKIELSSSETKVAVTPASVTVASGSKTATFSVTAEPVAASSKTTITGTDPSAKKATDVLVVDPPPVRITGLAVSPSTVVASATATGTVTLSADAPASGFKVDLTSEQTFVAFSPTVTVKSGAKTATFSISTTAVASDETATIRAADSNGYAEAAAVKVDVPTVRLTKLAISPTTVTAANPVTGTVTISAAAPSGGFVVNLLTTQTYIAIPASVTIKSGAKTATFTVATKPVLAAGTATVTAIDPSGYSSSATVVVNVPKVRIVSIKVSPATVNAGATATGTVTLSASAPSGGFVLSLSTMQSFVKLPLNVTVAAGNSSDTFTIGTGAVTSPSSATIEAKDMNGYSATSNMTVNPVSGTTISMTESLTFSPQSVTVAAGTSVIWNNTSISMSHTATSDVAANGPASSSVPPGGNYVWTVPANATSGTKFYYHCQYHGQAGNGSTLGTGMVGVVIVK